MSVESLNRTPEQELHALLRGASMECLVCGEFVLHQNGCLACPECGAEFGPAAAQAGLQLTMQAG